ncbi:hypothetical protein N480_05690 [Pseudoalteromonas luteoviolacea S2607]|uniref:questin oxidase family protein n=1 Tax=Pseudoalteromonas luteoviolacea TaxID=43657 RepID=UPI0007B08713|nr:questin oxidase family protein [Pseudoalteromonas luteoviolacea]KZN30445.1 hypothetical protein N480_05690 [Pseudoalteromonas luteoviolacea S2607]
MEEISPLNSILDKIAIYHPLYGGGLATHLPMVLTALTKLNAPHEKLLITFKNSIGDLELIESLDEVQAVTGVECELGNRQSYARYLKYYQAELLEHGVRQVLEKSLPSLISGIAASAFHGLIRLAYGIEAHSQSEVAIALAYWSSEYQAFDLTNETTEEGYEEILTRLSPYGAGFEFSPGIIVDRMDEIGGLLRRLEAVIQPRSIRLCTLRQFALKAFYLREDFTLLHTVTGCHAFSVIAPFLDDEEYALRSLWKAILVAYLSTGHEYKRNAIEVQQRQCCFDSVIQAALVSDDSHIIKLVYSCQCEYQNSGDALYYLIAHRAVSKLIR